MRFIFRLAGISAIAYGLSRFVTRTGQPTPAAFAPGEATPGPVEVRNAGPEAMASDMPEWDATDEASDESYPASDPPSSNKFT